MTLGQEYTSSVKFRVITLRAMSLRLKIIGRLLAEISEDGRPALTYLHRISTRLSYLHYRDQKTARSIGKHFTTTALTTALEGVAQHA